jgi:hypothetical protein
MQKTIYRSEDRGKANHGWLDTKFSFSFAEYYNPQIMNFGLLRVLNDDIIAPAKGFGTHPHNNMEIITIVLDGELEHRDSMGTGSVIHKNEVQVMSAGSGITHSEFNNSSLKKLNLLQLWIFPKEKNINPRYDQKFFPVNDRKNKLLTVVSGLNKEGSLYIHQNAEIKLGNFEKDRTAEYQINNAANGAYIFLIDGHIKIDGEELFKRDAVGISDFYKIKLEFLEDTAFVLIDVPMN